MRLKALNINRKVTKELKVKPLSTEGLVQIPVCEDTVLF